MIRVGALAPLTPPGLVPAGRDLQAGFELATDDVNDANSAGTEVELLIWTLAATVTRESPPSSTSARTTRTLAAVQPGDYRANSPGHDDWEGQRQPYVSRRLVGAEVCLGRAFTMTT